MKSIKLFLVFIALFLGASFCNSVVAQSGDSFVNQFVETSLVQSSSELKEAGIISSDVRLDGSVFVCTLLIDETVINVDMMGSFMDIAKEKSKSTNLFGDDDRKAIEAFESQKITCRCIVRENKSKKEIVRDLQPREFLAFVKFVSGDKAFADNSSIDDIVETLDKAFSSSKGDVKMRCVRRGRVIYLEQEAEASEYDDIKTAMDVGGWLVKMMLKKAIASDKKAKETFRSLAKQGYYFAYSVKCGDKEPVVIELNF